MRKGVKKMPVVWTATLTDEEMERADDEILEAMLIDLEVVWQKLKDDLLIEGGEQ